MDENKESNGFSMADDTRATKDIDAIKYENNGNEIDNTIEKEEKKKEQIIGNAKETNNDEKGKEEDYGNNKEANPNFSFNSKKDIVHNEIIVPSCENQGETEGTVNFIMHDTDESQDNINYNNETSNENNKFDDEPIGYENSYGGYYDARKVKKSEEDKKEEEYIESKNSFFSFSNIAIASLTLIASIVIGFVLGGCIIQHQLNSKNILISTTYDKIIENQSVKPSNELSVSTITQSCKSSVVAITTKSTTNVQTFFGIYEQSSVGSGSGVIIGKSNGELLIVTNNHVIDNATTVSVCFNDDNTLTYQGIVKGTDPSNDLAIVSVSYKNIDDEVLKDVAVATLGNSDELEIGDGVIAIGNALGMGQTVTTGIISAKERNVKLTTGVTIRLLQTDAAINPGNSGGALFNMKGELIGINTAKYASESVEGINFAIPITQVKDKLETLMSKKTRIKLESGYGCLSIVGKSITSDYTTIFGISEGVVITTVGEKGCAYQAGLVKGDIIIEFDDVKISSIEKLVERLQYYYPNETIQIKYLRLTNGEYVEYTADVTLDKEKIGITDSDTNNTNSPNLQNPNYYNYYDYYDYFQNLIPEISDGDIVLPDRTITRT